MEGGGSSSMGCKDGDKVRLVRQGGVEFSVYEIAVFLKLGEKRGCLDAFYRYTFYVDFEM